MKNYLSRGLSLFEIIEIAERDSNDINVYKKGDHYYLSLIDAKDYCDLDYEIIVEEIAESGFKNYLSTQTILECYNNLCMQMPDPSTDMIHAAVEYYYKHDGFMQI